MHRDFLDKRRRHLNLRLNQVEGVLPEHFGQYYPKFITLLKKYYEWQDQNDSTELINHLFATRDINETDLTLLSYIEDELLLGAAYFEGFGDTDAEKRAAANFSNVLFRSKGSKFAIEWFFRSFYGLDAEVLYPKENVFIVGDTESQIGPDSLRFLTNDKLYQTFALLVRVGIPISKWRDIFKLFVHPAGMYLGNEVTITEAINSTIISLMDDSAVDARTKPTYSLTYSVPGGTIQEGETITWTATANNLPNNLGAAFWYVDHATTNDSDFTETPPSSTNAKYLALDPSGGAATATFTTSLRLDSDETEGTEQFTLKLADQIGTVLATNFVSVEDVISTYAVTVTGSTTGVGTTLNEGELITFDLVGTNVPNNGNTTLFWHVVHGTTNDDDFTVAPPSEAEPQAITITNSIGTFSFRSIVDGLLDDGKTFDVVIKTAPGGSFGTAKNTTTITLNNAAPVLSVVANDVTEGQDFTAVITTDESNIGRTFDWAITGSATSGGRFSSTSGTIEITASSTTLTVPTTEDATYRGTLSGTLTVTNNSVPGTPPQGNDNFNIFDAAPVYRLVPNPLTAQQGDTIQFEITGTNIPPNPVNFFITHNTTSNSDFATVPPQSSTRQAITVTANATPNAVSPSLTFTDNGDTVDENFVAYIYSGTSGGSVLASYDFTILGENYSLTPSAASVNEGSSVTFTFTSPAGDGTYYYWVDGTNITSADFSSGYHVSGSRGTFTVSETTGTFTLAIANDFTIEGNETLNVYVSRTATGGVLATSSVTIADTGKPTYTVSAIDFVEGNPLQLSIASTSNTTETVYIEISGAGVTGRFPSTQMTKSITGSTTTSASFTTTLSVLRENDQIGTVTVSRGNYASLGGTTLATDTFEVYDGPSTFFITPSDDTPDEGTTINFAVTGSNVDGTYYYRVNNLVVKSVSTTTSGGSSIPISNGTDGLALGMSCSEPNVPGVITFIGPNSITMSSPITSMLLNTEVLHFAQPSVFADFSTPSQAFGSFTMAPVSGTPTGSFSIQLSSDGDTTNDVYTLSIYKFETSPLPQALGSSTFTIQDLSPTSNVILPADRVGNNRVLNSVNGAETRVTVPIAGAGIRFTSDGRILISNTFDYPSIFVPTSTVSGPRSTPTHIADWISDRTNLNGANYTVSATASTEVIYDNRSNTSITATTDVTPTTTGPFSLAQDRDFAVRVTLNATPNYVSYQVRTTFTITVTGPSNSDTMIVEADAAVFGYSGVIIDYGDIFG